MGLRDLVKTKYVPTKTSVSRVFNTDHKRQVKVELYNLPLEGVYGFNVSIRDTPEKISFDQFVTPGLSTVECSLFATRVSSCSLHPKLPACKVCPLAKHT